MTRRSPAITALRKRLLRDRVGRLPLPERYDARVLDARKELVRHSGPPVAEPIVYRALIEIDGAVAEWRALLRDDDLLILTADHGRAHRPAPITRGNTGLCSRPIPAATATATTGLLADVGASASHWITGRDTADVPGRSVRETH